MGAGLAGAVCAWQLGADRRVVLLEADRPGAGASGAAAGMVHRFLGARPRLVWRSGEALAGLRALLAEIEASDLFRECGVLRPARDEKHARALSEAAEDRSDLLTWMPMPAAGEHYPHLELPHGALLESEGGVVPVPILLDRLVSGFRAERGDYREGDRVTTVGDHRGRAVLRLDSGERIAADRVLLAVGAGYRTLPLLQTRGFEVVKGQTLCVEPPWPTDGLPSLVGSGYAAVFADRIVLGSTYEREFAHLRPDESGARRIRAVTAELQSSLRNAPLRSRSAGGRVMAPGHRKAAIGPLPDRPRVWVAEALGSKGLLLAGLLAREIETWYRDPDAIPERLSVPVRS